MIGVRAFTALDTLTLAEIESLFSMLSGQQDGFSLTYLPVKQLRDVRFPGVTGALFYELEDLA